MPLTMERGIFAIFHSNYFFLSHPEFSNDWYPLAGFISSKHSSFKQFSPSLIPRNCTLKGHSWPSRHQTQTFISFSLLTFNSVNEFLLPTLNSIIHF